jgi:hypothetical protein
VGVSKPLAPIVIALVPPSAPIQSRAAFTLAVGGALLFASTLFPSAGAERAVFALQALGVAVISFAIFLFVAASRVRGWKEFSLRIDETHVELPARPLSRREMARVPLDQIEMVSYAMSGSQGPRLEILAGYSAHILPFRWFPEKTNPNDVALRLHVRSQLARAKQSLEPAELAALEATLLAEKSHGAFVVERLNEPPEVLATIDSKEEEESVAATLKGKGAKLYDCSARILALREALERGLAAPNLPPSKPSAE